MEQRGLCLVFRARGSENPHWVLSAMVQHIKYPRGVGLHEKRPAFLGSFHRRLNRVNIGVSNEELVHYAGLYCSARLVLETDVSLVPDKDFLAHAQIDLVDRCVLPIRHCHVESVVFNLPMHTD